MTETELKLLNLIVQNGLLAWNSVLIGNPPPMIRETYKRMSNPVIGDLVLEITSWRATFDPDRLGWLRSIDTPKLGDDSRRYEQTYVVEPLIVTGAPLVCWRNCQFIALPTEPGFVQRSGPPFPGAS